MFSNEGAGESLSSMGSRCREEGGEWYYYCSSSVLLKIRSSIKWHKLAHLSQTRDGGVISWYHAVWLIQLCLLTHITPKLGYLCRRVLCDSVTRFPLPYSDVLFPEITLPHLPERSFFLSDWYLDSVVYMHTDIFSPSLLCFLCCSWHYLNGWV